MSTDRLRRFYARTARDGRFLASRIRLDDLAAALGVDETMACRVGLCTLPGERDREMWLDRVSERFGIDRDRLEHVLARIGAS